MSSDLGTLQFTLDFDDKDLNKNLDKSEKKVKDFGDSVEKSGESMTKGLNTAAAGLAVAGAGLTLYAKNATDFTVDLVKSSKSLGREIGASTEEASRLVAAMGRMGVSTEQASTAFGIFSKNIKKATEESEDTRLAQQKLAIDIEKTKKEITDTTAEIKKHGDKSGELNLKLKSLNNTLETQTNNLDKTSNAFQQLGIETVGADGIAKDFNTILFEVADKFKGMPDGIEKTALSMQLFGRSGKDMIPILNQGSQGIKDLEAQADKLGLTLTKDTIGKINDLVTSQKDLKQQTDALKIAVGTATAPVLTKFNTQVNNIVEALMNAPKPIRDVTTAVLAFGGPVAGATSGLVGFVANAATVVPKVGAMASSVSLLTTALIALNGTSLATTIGLTGALNSSITSNQQAMQGLGFDTAQLKAGFDPLKVSADFLAQSTRMVADAENQASDAANRLKDANYNLEGANLRVESAQRNYTDAVKRFGPDSLQARQAQHDLAGALQDQKTAADNAKKANEEKAKKDAELAKKKDLENSSREANSQLQTQEGLLDRIGSKVKNLGKSAGNKATDAGGGLLRMLPGFATGVRNFGGGLAMVGERGPELVNLPKGSDVIPNDRLDTALRDTPDMGGQNVTVNLHLEGVYANSRSAVREMGMDIIAAVNEGLRAQGKQEIGV